MQKTVEDYLAEYHAFVIKAAESPDVLSELIMRVKNNLPFYACIGVHEHSPVVDSGHVRDARKAQTAIENEPTPEAMKQQADRITQLRADLATAINTFERMVSRQEAAAKARKDIDTLNIVNPALGKAILTTPA